MYIDFGAPQARKFWLFTLNCRLNCRTSTISTHCYKCSTIPQVLQFFKLKFKNVLQFSLKVLQFSKFSSKAMFYNFLMFYQKFYDSRGGVIYLKLHGTCVWVQKRDWSRSDHFCGILAIFTRVSVCSIEPLRTILFQSNVNRASNCNATKYRILCRIRINK